MSFWLGYVTGLLVCLALFFACICCRACLQAQRRVATSSDSPQPTGSLGFVTVGQPAFNTSKTSIVFTQDAAIHTNLPLPSRQTFYFEILCLRLPVGAALVLALRPKTPASKLRALAASEQIGDEDLLGPSSITLNILQGAVQLGSHTAAYPVLANVQASDTIGCLVTATPTLSFSKNGVAGPPVVFSTNDTPQYITVAGTTGVHFMFNFGDAEFMYRHVAAVLAA